MNYFLFTIFVLFQALAIPCLAYTPKEGNVSSVIGPFIHKTNFRDSDTGATSPWLGGLSFLAIGDLNDHGSLELGFYFMNKTFFRKAGAKFIGEEAPILQVNMGYRYWMMPSLSASLSINSSYPMDDYQIIHNDFNSPNDIDTSAREPMSFGADAGIQVEAWTNGKDSVEIDTRYSRAMSYKTDESADHYGFSVGWRHFIQGKNP